MSQVTVPTALFEDGDKPSSKKSPERSSMQLENCRNTEEIKAYFESEGQENDPDDLARELVCGDADVSLTLSNEAAAAGVRVGIQAIEGKSGKFFSLRRFLDIEGEDKSGKKGKEKRYVDKSWMVNTDSNTFARIEAIHARLVAAKKQMDARLQSTHHDVDHVVGQI